MAGGAAIKKNCRSLPRRIIQLSRVKFSVLGKKVRAVIFKLLANHDETAGPTLFRGHLRAFGKCTNGVALSKGRQNLDSTLIISLPLPKR